MVELEEVEDPELQAPQPGPTDDDDDSADYTDTGSSIRLLSGRTAITSHPSSPSPFHPPSKSLFPQTPPSPPVPSTRQLSSLRPYPRGYLLCVTWYPPAPVDASLAPRPSSPSSSKGGPCGVARAYGSSPPARSWSGSHGRWPLSRSSKSWRWKESRGPGRAPAR